MKSLSIAFALLLLPVPAVCQSGPPKNAKADAAEQQLFHAFWLDRAEGKTTEAVQLYREFLTANPKHEQAPRAAAYALVLLRRSDTSEAERFTREHAALLEQVDADLLTDDRAGRGRGRGGGRFGRGPNAGGRDAVGRGGRDGRGGGRGRGRGGRGGGRAGGRGAGRAGGRGVRGGTTDTPPNPLTARMPVPLDQMSAEQRQEFVARYSQLADQYIAELRAEDQAARAEQLTKSIAEIRKLIDGDKLQDAQRAIERMQRSIR